MFRKYDNHLQPSLFSTAQQLPKTVRDRLERSWAPVFRSQIFESIDEERYAVLYSDACSRPNFPVNVLVSLDIIKWLFDYTDEDLLDQFHFNLLTAYALGQEELGYLTICPRTLYNFRGRILDYETRTGINLLDEEFKFIGKRAIEEFCVNAKIQRMDSSLIGSFIKRMSRLEMLVKVMQNFYRDLSTAEQERWKEQLSFYTKSEPDHITFRLKRKDVVKHLKQVGKLLFELHKAYQDDDAINGLKSYQHVGRVLLEQYDLTINDEQPEINVKASKISTDSLQNPADDEATYRKKGTKESQGYLLNVAETCAKDSPLQIITDVSVHKNNESDAEILAERIPEIKEHTAVEEMITDAAYAGEASETACEKTGVKLIPTEIRGRKETDDQTPLRAFIFDNNHRLVACPRGEAPIYYCHKKKTGRHVVHFSLEQCRKCPFLGVCRVQKRKKFYSLIYTDRQTLLALRRQQLSEDNYRQKCRLRPAIEGTISQFKRTMPNGKLKVRGLQKGRNTCILRAMAINFKRVVSYLQSDVAEYVNSLENSVFVSKYKAILDVLPGTLLSWIGLGTGNQIAFNQAACVVESLRA